MHVLQALGLRHVELRKRSSAICLLDAVLMVLSCRQAGAQRMHEGFWRQAASGGLRGGKDGPGSPPGGGSAAKLKGKRAALPKRKAMRALAKATRCASAALTFFFGWLAALVPVTEPKVCCYLLVAVR